jgi:exopolyphosphatase/guanosine-5'-triphosphate,3'-diphosphate pyrophosphatase
VRDIINYSLLTILLIKMANQQTQSSSLPSRIPRELDNQKYPKLLRYAAIDIGSNAVRLLLCNAVEEHGERQFKKGELVRIPLRLGEDAFQNGRISYQRVQRLIKTMQAFKLLIDVFDPVAYRACATASLREAINGEDIVKQIRRECGLKIEIISGKTEAELIYSNHVEEHLERNKSFLYIDVGGGSTEITLFDKGQCVLSQSRDIGTIRFLKNQVTKEKWSEFKDWIKEISSYHQPLTAIGSGGNINKIFKMMGGKDKPLTYNKIRELYEEMKVHSVQERMELWSLNPDRADVIVPAAKIFLAIMKAAQIENIIVPQIGLADGIVHQLHEHYKESMVA